MISDYKSVAEVFRELAEKFISKTPCLRDQFAMAAMNRCIGEHCKTHDQVAEQAYEYADAMMKARKPE